MPPKRRNRIRHEAGAVQFGEKQSNTQSSIEKESSNESNVMNNMVKSTSSNVVFSQNEKNYEPVKIIETKDEVKIQSPKYRRRPIVSNWKQYDGVPLDYEPVEGEDYNLGEDFMSLLNLKEKCGSSGFLHLKQEKSWSNMEKQSTIGLGDLKISDLVQALSTLPLYEQLKIPETSIPAYMVNEFKKEAEKNLQSLSPSKNESDSSADESILKDILLTNSFKFERKKKDELVPIESRPRIETRMRHRVKEEVPIESEPYVLFKANSSDHLIKDDAQFINDKKDIIDNLENKSNEYLELEHKQDLEITNCLNTPPNEVLLDHIEPTDENRDDSNKKNSSAVHLLEKEVENLEEWLDSVLDD